jgi:hypothetical protein
MRFVIFALALGLAACASTPATNGSGSGGGANNLGSQQNPVRVNMPPGERAYLSRLRCSDGAAPSFSRMGSSDGGGDGHILDVYAVRCAAGEPRESEIWMDMYHPTHTERGAPPGFTLVQP